MRGLIVPDSARVFQVVHEIQDRIASGRYVPGQQIPPEREFCAALGVSRSVLREALSTLAGMGLVKTRQGSGTRIQPPSSRQVSESYERLLSRHDHHPEHLCAVRLPLETSIAALAAIHRTDEHLEGLRRTQRVLARPRQSIGKYTDADLEFHSILADASGNPMFEVVLAPIQGLLMEYRRRAVPRFGADVVLEHHGRILAAVEAGDAENASQCMR